jgi:hypothetical protein
MQVHPRSQNLKNNRQNLLKQGSRHAAGNDQFIIYMQLRTSELNSLSPHMYMGIKLGL